MQLLNSKATTLEYYTKNHKFMLVVSQCITNINAYIIQIQIFISIFFIPIILGIFKHIVKQIRTYVDGSIFKLVRFKYTIF